MLSVQEAQKSFVAVGLVHGDTQSLTECQGADFKRYQLDICTSRIHVL